MQKAVDVAATDEHVVLGYTTVSGHGYRMIVGYELNRDGNIYSQMRDYREVFKYVNQRYAALVGVMADGQCKDLVRLSACAPDPNAIYRPDAKIFSREEVFPTGKIGSRKQKSMVNKLDNIFSKLIEKKLEEAGVRFEPHSHNNYLMRVAYEFNRLGIDEEMAVEWGRKHYAGEYPEFEATIRGSYRAAVGEHGADRQRLEDLKGNRANKDIRPFATIEDIEHFVSDCIVTRYNVVSGRLEYRTVDSADGLFANVDDNIVYSLWRRMSRDFRVNDRHIRQILESDYSIRFNPLVEYLNGLPEWLPSMPDHIAMLANTVRVEGDDKEQELFGRHLRKWLVGMIAAWVNPEVVNHLILVFLGRQGVYKTSWFGHLLPPELAAYYCTKANSALMSKDDLLLFSQCALMNFDEIGALDSNNASFLKSAVTIKTTTVRAPYAHYAEQRKHIASLCGTGNNRRFLNDDTGSRRWLVYWVEHIDSPYEHTYNYDGLYSQALYLYRSGFRYWFNKDETAEQELHNARFNVNNMERELILSFFRKPYPGEVGEIFPASAILSYIANGLGAKLTVERVNRAMDALGFEKRRTSTMRGWLCIRLLPTEMQDMRKRNAMDSDPDSDLLQPVGDA